MKGLQASTVLPEKHVCTQTFTLQLNSVPDLKTTFIIAHRLVGNGTSNSRHSENQGCTNYLLCCFLISCIPVMLTKLNIFFSF